MAVVPLQKASAARDTTTGPIDPIPAEVSGRGHVAPFVSTAEIANGTSATSTVYFGEIPSNARIGLHSRIDCDAITGLTSFDLGLGKGADLGNYVVGDADCLIAAATLAAAASKAVTAIDIANAAKTAWQLAGYTDDPGGTLSVVGTINADAGAAGTVTLSLFLYAV